MKQLPSIKSLEQAFPGKSKVMRKLLESADAVRAHPAAIARENECYHFPPLHDLRLHALNAEAETYGVEYIERYKGDSVSFDYLNVGDPYTPTLVRFVDGRYRVSSWGDIVERGNYK